MLRNLWPLLAFAACGPSAPAKVLSPMTLVTMVPSNHPDQEKLFEFADSLVGDSWFPAVTGEYGLALPARAVRVSAAPLEGPLTTDQALSELRAAAAEGPAPDGNTLYLFYVPPAASVTDAAFEATHGAFLDGSTSRGDAWALVTPAAPYPGGETPLQSATRLASHEVVEAATDPLGTGVRFGTLPAQPWNQSVWLAYKSEGELELADRCEGTRVLVADAAGTWEYQRSWSERASACVPKAGGPDYTVTAPAEWVSGKAGDAVMIPLSGKATGPRDDWMLAVSVASSSGALGAATVQLSSEGGTWAPPGCLPYPRVRDGEGLELRVSLPSNAQRGDWAVLALCSFEEDASTCYAPLTEDVCHLALVGLFVE